ncbi:hypothetical protein EIL81_17800 [Photorhabdus laumondii subsp. laumondii]|nr:hypothetical protein [Photorhabdus laumondii subsp. laumondii]
MLPGIRSLAVAMHLEIHRVYCFLTLKPLTINILFAAQLITKSPNPPKLFSLIISIFSIIFLSDIN